MTFTAGHVFQISEQSFSRLRHETDVIDRREEPLKLIMMGTHPRYGQISISYAKRRPAHLYRPPHTMIVVSDDEILIAQVEAELAKDSS